MDIASKQDEFAIKYVVLTQDILCNKELAPSDKLVLARMSGFEIFFESPEATAELLGISADKVRKAKQKLEKLGYIETVQNSGRGKVWRVVRLVKLTNQTRQFNQSDWLNQPIENKIENRLENISTINSTNKQNASDEAVEKSEVKETYGNKEVNTLLALWEQETGIVANVAKQNRYACYNLLRTRGFDGACAVVRMVGKSIKSRDRFAPRIGSFRDLVGKFEKLSALEAWNIRYTTENGNNIVSPIRFGIPDSCEEEVVSDSEHERVSAMFKEARKNLGLGGKK